MLQQTTPHRRRRLESLVVLDDTLGEQVGSLFDDVDRHDNHSDGTYPLAHNPVTSLSVSGPVRFPLGLRLYRRYEELTQWEAAVAKHFPELPIPRENKARNRLHTQVDPVLLQDPECRARHAQFQTNIALAIDLVEEAIGSKVSFGVVVFDAWYLAEDLIKVLARRRKDWISLLKKNRLLETASFQLRDVNGWAMKLPGPHIAVEDLVPLIPATAYRRIKVSEQTYWCFTLGVRIAGLGKVRIERRASSKPLGTPVGNKGVRCCNGCWCSSMTSCPTAPRLTISLHSYSPSSVPWYPDDLSDCPQSQQPSNS
jgi:hypothetical protein